VLGYDGGLIPRYAALPLLALALCACKPAEEGHVKVIIGAVLIDGAGGPPLTNSVVVVAGGRIRAAGAHSNVPIPADADKIDGAGKFLVPALVDVCDRADPPGFLRPATLAEARIQVAELAARKVAAIHIGKLPPTAAEGVLAAARDARIPVTGHIATQAEARFLEEQGVSVLVGMIRDTEDLDPVLVSRLRDLRIVVAPSLAHAGAAIEIARHNTRRLFQAGVPLAVASEGGDPLREAELMAEAGVPPLDVIVAATRNGAMALHQLEDRGAIEAEKRADLLLVSANPGEDIKNLRRVALRMVAGEWGML
jgi:imidazolonepropionase-like amidohydrolase